MNRTARITCVATVLLLSIAFPRPARAIDWQPISPDDLALKDNPKQPGADAMILYLENVIDAKSASDNGDSDEEYIRIKIFTQAGTKWGSVQIPYIRNQGEGPYQVTSDIIDVKDIRGRTIHPDGTILNFDGQVVEKELVNASGVKYLAKTFNLPDVQPGSIIEYKYRRQGSPRYVNSATWNVSREMFVRDARFSYSPIVPKTYAQSVPAAYFRSYGLPSGAAPQRRVDGTFFMELHDIPAVVREAMMPPERVLEARVSFYYRSIDEPVFQTPQEFWSHMMKKWNGELEHFVDKKSVLEQELAKIVSPSDSPEVKIRKIYARVQQIRNLNEEGPRTQDVRKQEDIQRNSNVEDVLMRNYGTGRDLNYLFVGLARAAGFDANEVFLAQRSRDIFTPETTDEHQLTANVVWIRVGSQEYYVDPASRYYPFGLLPWPETESGGVRLNKNGPDFVNTPRSASTDATRIRQVNLDVAEDGSASGVLMTDFTGQEAAVIRQQERNEDDTGRMKYLEQVLQNALPPGSTLEVTKIANWEDKNQPIHAEATVKIPSFATATSHVLLAPLDLFQLAETKSFAPGKRVNSIYFRYAYETIDDLKFRAPSGYQFANIPPEQKINLGAASYAISATRRGDTLEVNRHLVVNGILFSKDAYPTLRTFFGNVKANDAAQVTLQSAQSASNN